jgi:hypothetical protein
MPPDPPHTPTCLEQPPRTRNMYWCPLFHPHMCAPLAWHPPFDNRSGHMTVLGCDQFWTMTHATDAASPCYVPPTLCNNIKTSYRSQQLWSNSFNNWRDLPPHKTLSSAAPKCSDSPNWRTPSFNCPISFLSLSPPQSPPAPLVSSLHTLKPLPTPQQHCFDSQLSSELILIIKTATEALQGIVQLA